MTDDKRPLRAPHVTAAGVAILLFLVFGAGSSRLVRDRVERQRYQLAALPVSVKTTGALVQRVVAADRAILPLYGSSELVRASAFRASDFFASRPTGFAVSPVGARGTPPLVTLQQIAAAAGALRGGRLVLLVTPQMFFQAEGAHERRVYAGNFSRLQAGALLFGDLPLDVRRRAAVRLREFPSTLVDLPVLRAAAASLAEGSRAGRVLFTILRPLGRLELTVLEWQDAWRVARNLRWHPEWRTPTAARPMRPDWSELERRATRAWIPQASNNRFRFESNHWDSYGASIEATKGSRTDSSFVADLARTPAWEDLDLILETLASLDVEPLVISLPMVGPLSDFEGTTARARSDYYAKLCALAVRRGARCVSLEDREYSPYFMRDAAHPSPIGWIVIDSIINAFHHDDPA